MTIEQLCRPAEEAASPVIVSDRDSLAARSYDGFHD